VSKTSSPNANPRRNDLKHARLKLEELKLRFSYRLSLAGFVVASLVITLGAGMVFLGLQGSIDFGVKVLAINAKLVNASPGIVFAAIGVILCCVILNRNAVKVSVKRHVTFFSREPAILWPTGGLSYHDSTQCFTDSTPTTLPLPPHRQ
jgi:hypothetical protein